jgi:serine protease inhibitor
MRKQRRGPGLVLGIIAAMMVAAVAVIPARRGAAEQSAAPAAFAINDFGLRLLRTLTTGNEAQNTVISPVSVAMALAMTYNGSAGETHLAMMQALRIEALGDDFNPLNRALLKTIKSADPSVQIAIANALWAQKGFRIAPDFVKAGRTYYGASMRSLDFAGNPSGAAAVINRWVDKATRGKIPVIVDKPDPNTRLVLTDAVYFKGKWTWPFPKAATAPHDFHVGDGSTIKTPMMRLDHDFECVANDDLQAVRLPYGNQRFVMYVLLPRKQGGVAEMVAKLGELSWHSWTAGLKNQRGLVMLPKFTLTYKAQLNDALKKMGMGVAFTDDADFSRIHPPPPPLAITDVEHRTLIKVEETGTEAAAATSVSVGLMMAVARPQPFEMVVDHPFLFAITERQSGAMLFTGVVANPSAD